MLVPVWAYPQATCTASPLSDQQVKDIIATERAKRTDLPSAFPNYRSTVRRQGCHYVYIEYLLPEAPDAIHVFKLNQYGVIVDAEPGNPKCPEKVFAESELAEIVKNERARRKDLPPAFPNSRIRVDRERCLYLYFEYAVPERRGDYQVFTIDPLGELMEFSRSKPY
jgi:hypothetical protein